MALSFIASSSLVLGRTAKAATLSGTSYTATNSTLLLNAKVDNSYYSDKTVKNTHLTWDSIPGAAKYELDVSVPVSSTSDQSYHYGEKFTKDGIVYIHTSDVNGSCFVKITAYDSNGNTIRSEMYQYKSKANIITFKTAWVVQ